MALESFNAYHSYLKSMEPLNDVECGRLFRACLEYSMSGAAPELRGNERFLFPAIREQIDRDKQKYTEKCTRLRENSTKGVLARANQIGTKCNQMVPTDNQIEPKDKDKDTKENSPSESKRKSFVPPTVDEVSAYCTEKGYHVEPDRFVDFYTANGWKQGRVKPIVDWRAAVRTWERREKPAEPPAGGGYGDVV